MVKTSVTQSVHIFKHFKWKTILLIYLKMSDMKDQFNFTIKSLIDSRIYLKQAGFTDNEIEIVKKYCSSKN